MARSIEEIRVDIRGLEAQKQSIDDQIEGLELEEVRHPGIIRAREQWRKDNPGEAAMVDAITSTEMKRLMRANPFVEILRNEKPAGT